MDSVRTLVELGANVNAEDNHKWTPIFHAIISKFRNFFYEKFQKNISDTPKVRTHIEHGAKINIQDDKEFTPLHQAVLMGINSI